MPQWVSFLMVLEGTHRWMTAVVCYGPPKQSIMVMAWSPLVQRNLELSFSLHIPTVFRNNLSFHEFCSSYLGCSKIITIASRKKWIKSTYDFPLTPGFKQGIISVCRGSSKALFPF